MDSAAYPWLKTYRHPSAWDMPIEPMTLCEMFERSAARHAQAPLIDFMGRTYRFAQVKLAADRVAAGLLNLGLQPGARVGLYLPNVPHYVAAYYGVLAMGGVVVNFSPLYAVDELAAQAVDSGARTLITLSAAALLPQALAVLDKGAIERVVAGSVAGVLPAVKSIAYRLFKRGEVEALPDDPRVMRFSALIANDGRFAQPRVLPEDAALIQYTGGTTGTPKGAVLTHQNMSANARQVDAIDPEPDAEDRIVGVLPFFHVFANTCVLNRTVWSGGMIAMLPRFDAGAALKTIARVKATALPGVPTMYQALLDHPDTVRTDFSSLRVCISGGAPLPLDVKDRFEAVTGATLVEGYGLTESSGVIAANPYQGLNKPGTIGQPIPGTEIILLDREDPARRAAHGEAGEIAFRGPQAMRGYWNRPDADKEAFADGWVRTGDVGEIDEDGYIRIVDRIKDMIAVGGFKVFPSTVEAVLYRHPEVKEALVIGVPDAYAGERPKAFVTLNAGGQADGAALMAWLNPQLGKHERVIAVEVRQALPKTMIGKLSRKELVAEERAKAGA